MGWKYGRGRGRRAEARAARKTKAYKKRTLMVVDVLRPTILHDHIHTVWLEIFYGKSYPAVAHTLKGREYLEEFSFVLSCCQY